MLKEILIPGNLKMGYEVYIFNLPPVKTCTPTKWCLEGNNGKPRCYALKNNFLLANVKKGAEERYEFSKQKDFVDKMVNVINRKEIEFFRFHASGDFYSEEYVEKIIQIVKRCPDTLFRTTTRRLDLSDAIEELDKLPNMIVRESLDSERQRQKTNLLFTALSYLPIVKQKKSYHCKEDCVECNYYCWKNRCNVNFDEF